MLLYSSIHYLISPPIFVQYAQLIKQGKDKAEQCKTASPTKMDIYETEISAFHRQKKQLADTLPADQKHLLNGLLYYRVRTASTLSCGYARFSEYSHPSAELCTPSEPVLVL
jgi:hypothetical protein